MWMCLEKSISGLGSGGRLVLVAGSGVGVGFGTGESCVVCSWSRGVDGGFGLGGKGTNTVVACSSSMPAQLPLGTEVARPVFLSANKNDLICAVSVAGT